MSEPAWPEWGGEQDTYYPWHVWTSPVGAHHAGYLLDTVIGPSLAEPGTQQVYEILRCESCIAIHATPLPSQNVLASYYKTAFYQQDKPDYLGRTERDRQWWEQCIWGPILQQCQRYLPDVPGERRDVFDIGTGPAISLDVAARLGMGTYGLEPNAHIAALVESRGHTMYCETMETFTSGNGGSKRWDIITAYEVLEHQAEPEDFLLRCYDMLKSGGILALCVPNDYSPIQCAARHTLGMAPWWVAPPQHLYYWTPKTLQLQVRRCGLAILDIRGTFPLDQALLDGDNYLGNDALGRIVHGRRMLHELQMVRRGWWPQVEAEYRANMRQRIGREIVVIAQKVA